MSDNCCPNCGSEDAVPKGVAWDALTKVPHKIINEIEALRLVNDRAGIVVTSIKLVHPEGTPFYQIPTDALEELAKAMKR